MFILTKKICFFCLVFRCFHTPGATRTPATNISDIIDVIIEKREEKNQSAVSAATSIEQVIEKEEYGYGSGITVTQALGIGINNGIFEYGLQAHDVLFITLVFNYCGFNGNIIAGLTAIAIAVAVVTRNENKNNGVKQILKDKKVLWNIMDVCFVLFVKYVMIIHMYNG